MRSRPEKQRLHKLDPKVHWSRVLGYVQLEIYEEARIELSMIPDDENWAKQKRMMEVEIFQHQEDWSSRGCPRFADGVSRRSAMVDCRCVCNPPKEVDSGGSGNPLGSPSLPLRGWNDSI